MPSLWSLLGRKLSSAGGECLPEVGTALSLPGQLTTFPPASAFPAPYLGPPPPSSWEWPGRSASWGNRRRRVEGSPHICDARAAKWGALQRPRGAMEGGAPRLSLALPGGGGELGHQGARLPQHPGEWKEAAGGRLPWPEPTGVCGGSQRSLWSSMGTLPDLTPGDTPLGWRLHLHTRS